MVSLSYQQGLYTRLGGRERGRGREKEREMSSEYSIINEKKFCLVYFSQKAICIHVTIAMTSVWVEPLTSRHDKDITNGHTN